jgi:hypothetical protein
VVTSVYVFIIVIYVNSLVPVPAPLLFCCDVGSCMGLPVAGALMRGVSVAVCKQKETSPPTEYTYVTLTNVNSFMSGF